MINIDLVPGTPMVVLYSDSMDAATRTADIVLIPKDGIETISRPPWRSLFVADEYEVVSGVYAKQPNMSTAMLGLSTLTWEIDEVVRLARQGDVSLAIVQFGKQGVQTALLHGAIMSGFKISESKLTLAFLVEQCETLHN